MRLSPSLLLVATTSYLSSIVDAQKYPPNDYRNLQGYIGCFKSPGGLKETGQDTFQTSGKCREFCKGKKYSGMTRGSVCWCGDSLPSESDQLGNDQCKKACQGYGWEPCGSANGHFTIITTDPVYKDPRLYDGDKNGSADEDEDEDTGDNAATSTSPPLATVTKEGQTIVITKPAETDKSNHENKGNGMSKAGAAAGAVVGVLLALAVSGGIFLFIRNQRRRKVEEEYKRSAAVMEYGVKEPSSDLRLDPVMLQRRMSDGSIADNQDYSRRILKVTNPDGN